MKKLILSIILLISFTSCKNENKTNTTEVTPESTIETEIVENLGSIKNSTPRALKSNYEIYAMGHGDVFQKTFLDTVRSIGKNKYAVARKGYILFNKDTIRLETNKDLGRTFITENEQEFYVFYTAQNYEEGISQAVCVDKTTLQIKWKHPIGVFNLSDPIIDGDAVYISSSDHISKLSLKTGKFYWKLDNLYDQYKIKYIAKTIFKENFNLYLYPKQFPSNEYDTLYVNDASGKIITSIISN